MKIAYQHLKKNIKSNPSYKELSEKLFQLGHEHEISNNILEMEFTPNRGDCLSLDGLLRDLALFYNVSLKRDYYRDEIDPFEIDFVNNSEKFCNKISFLKIQVKDIPNEYNGLMKNYFSDLDIKKNNFFADVSNYISYETGQPTHCYDSEKIYGPIKLEFLDKSCKFETLLEKTIELDKQSLVFMDCNNQIINLAGIIGAKNTSCHADTKSVIVECAYFDPEIILGKSLKYGINSEAAHKFERNTDRESHDYVLRRFIKIVENHANIEKIELFSKSYTTPKIVQIPFDVNAVNQILGTNINKTECTEYLTKLGFEIQKDTIFIPSFRNDVTSINDISEEIARAKGYDNIKDQNFKINIPSVSKSKASSEENKLKSLLIDQGFYEVINDPFVSQRSINSVIVDNPLDSNRKFLREDLKNSLISNLSYNERRQKDSIKLFEISDIYLSNSTSVKRVLGIIASGRIGKNYRDFSKNINQKYIKSLLGDYIKLNDSHFIDVPREEVDSKSKSIIVYLEIEINNHLKINYQSNYIPNINNINYSQISDFPSSSRDISFSLKDLSKCKVLERSILGFNHDLLKEAFIFDYYINKNTNEIKIGFRFTFQSHNKTITDKDVEAVMKIIISKALSIDTVCIPGLS